MKVFIIFVILEAIIIFAACNEAIKECTTIVEVQYIGGKIDTLTLEAKNVHLLPDGCIHGQRGLTNLPPFACYVMKARILNLKCK